MTINNYIFLFICIFLSIYLDLNIIQKDDPIRNKLYLFIGVFLLETVILSINNTNSTNSSEKNQNFIINKALKNAMFSVIAYSIYLDLIFYPQFNSKIQNILVSENLKTIFVSFFISTLCYLFNSIDNSLLNTN